MEISARGNKFFGVRINDRNVVKRAVSLISVSRYYRKEILIKKKKKNYSKFVVTSFEWEGTCGFTPNLFYEYPSTVRND